MRDFIKFFLLVINVLSFVLVVVSGIAGIAYEILGPAKFEKLLAKFNISWSFEQVWNVSFICLVVLAITYFLRTKFFVK